MKPASAPSTEPSPDLAAAIDDRFGSLDMLQAAGLASPCARARSVEATVPSLFLTPRDGLVCAGLSGHLLHSLVGELW